MRRVDEEVRRLTAETVRELDVEDALRIVDDSGVAEVLEQQMPKGSGRPRVHTWRSLSMFLCK